MRRQVCRFRPLTGILFFNLSCMKVEESNVAAWFPSPYGDFVFQR